MKAVWIALIFLIFNISMGTVTQSGLFTTSSYYEDTVIENYGGMADFSNLSKTQEEQEYYTVDMFQIIINTLTFNWAFQYTNALGITAQASFFITGLNIIMYVIIAVAFIEFFWRRSDILPNK